MALLSDVHGNLPAFQAVLDDIAQAASRLRELGFAPLESHANFLLVPVADPKDVAQRLLQLGLAVRPVRDGIRITIRSEEDDDRLLEGLVR